MSRSKAVLMSNSPMSITLGTFALNDSTAFESKSPLYNKAGLSNDSAPINLFQKDFKRISNSDMDVWSTNNHKGTEGGHISNLYKSILDLLEKLRFRGMFYRDNSNTLYITNSPSPTKWQVVTKESYFFEENECTSFSTTGKALTKDGREIEFNLDLQMSRKYTETTELSYISKLDAVLTDPLVINLDSSPVSISDQTFLFDINNDGKEECIYKMNSSSGFLAFDKNEDGIINDGNELFGTKTGNGFDELAEYDLDGNGWIDEADEIYSKLKVWIKDEAGNDKLLTLKEADVGAIYLGNSSTEFSLTDSSNSLNAQVRSTGIYLHENGLAGTIQQVDF